MLPQGVLRGQDGSNQTWLPLKLGQLVAVWDWRWHAAKKQQRGRDVIPVSRLESPSLSVLIVVLEAEQARVNIAEPSTYMMIRSTRREDLSF